MAWTLRGRKLGLICGFVSVASCGGGPKFSDLFPDSEGGASIGARASGAASAGQLSNGGRGGTAGNGSSMAGTSVAGPGGGRASAGGGNGTSGHPGTNGARDGEGGTPAGASGVEPAPDPGGAGGEEQSAECDDDNACTFDSLLQSGACKYAPIECSANGACLTATCDPARGCGSTVAPDGSACDDGKTCTSSDVCQSGLCSGTIPAFTLDKTVMEEIPDGEEKCHGFGNDLGVSFDVTSAAVVGSVVVEVDFEHPYVSELEFVLTHEQSGRSVKLLANPPPLGVKANGRYSFAEGGTAFPLDMEYYDLPVGTYAPADSFAAGFQGVALGGTWTLLFHDKCGGDVGAVRAVTLRLTGQACT